MTRDQPPLIVAFLLELATGKLLPSGRALLGLRNGTEGEKLRRSDLEIDRQHRTGKSFN